MTVDGFDGDRLVVGMITGAKKCVSAGTHGAPRGISIAIESIWVEYIREDAAVLAHRNGVSFARSH